MNVVSIIGKANVGKSTLFNRIIEKRKAIVDDEAGITRDRIYGNGEWLTKKFQLIDTGGYSLKKATFQENINTQVMLAIEESNIIIFLVSYQDEVDADDLYIGKLLKKYAKNKTIILACNKTEKLQSTNANTLFYNLGFGEPVFISSAHGIGIGDLLDNVIKHFNPSLSNIDEGLTFCIIGKPNVGKSSLANAILQKQRVIVSDIPGTTRDSIDVNFKYQNEHYTLIDTAGIRRKGKIQGIEKYAVLRGEMAVARSQVILLMLDASNEFSEQDEIISGLAIKANIPTIIIINKIDLIERSDIAFNNLKKLIRARFTGLSWAPIIFISALDNKKISHIFEEIHSIKSQLEKKVSTSLLNEVLLKAQMLQQPPQFKGSRINIKYATQVKSQIPTFVIFCTHVNSLHFSYARYIENKVRTTFGFDKVPITLFWKDKNAATKGIKYE